MAKTSKHLSDRKFRRKKKKRKKAMPKRTREEIDHVLDKKLWQTCLAKTRTRAESDRNKSTQCGKITKDRAI